MENPPDRSTCEDSLTTRERAALALWLVQQMPYTTNVLAAKLGMTASGAGRLMRAISRVVPIYFCDGEWHICKTDN